MSCRAASAGLGAEGARRPGPGASRGRTPPRGPGPGPGGPDRAGADGTRPRESRRPGAGVTGRTAPSPAGWRAAAWSDEAGWSVEAGRPAGPGGPEAPTGAVAPNGRMAAAGPAGPTGLTGPAAGASADEAATPSAAGSSASPGGLSGGSSRADCTSRSSKRAVAVAAEHLHQLLVGPIALAHQLAQQGGGGAGIAAVEGVHLALQALEQDVGVAGPTEGRRHPAELGPDLGGPVGRAGTPGTCAGPTAAAGSPPGPGARPQGPRPGARPDRGRATADSPGRWPPGSPRPWVSCRLIGTATTSAASAARGPMARTSLGLASPVTAPASSSRATVAWSSDAGAAPDHLDLDLPETGRQAPAVHDRDHVVVDLEQRLSQATGQNGPPALGDQPGDRAQGGAAPVGPNQVGDLGGDGAPPARPVHLAPAEGRLRRFLGQLQGPLARRRRRTSRTGAEG